MVYVATSISGGSAPDFVDTGFSGTGHYDGIYTLNYQAEAAGQERSRNRRRNRTRRLPSYKGRDDTVPLAQHRHFGLVICIGLGCRNREVVAGRFGSRAGAA